MIGRDRSMIDRDPDLILHTPHHNWGKFSMTGFGENVLLTH